MDLNDLGIAISMLAVMSMGIAVTYPVSQDSARVNFEIKQLAVFEQYSGEAPLIEPRQNAWGGWVAVRHDAANSKQGLVYTGVTTAGCAKFGLEALSHGSLALAVNGAALSFKEQDRELDLDRLVAACNSSSANTLIFSKK